MKLNTIGRLHENLISAMFMVVYDLNMRVINSPATSLYLNFVMHEAMV